MNTWFCARSCSLKHSCVDSGMGFIAKQAAVHFRLSRGFTKLPRDILFGRLSTTSITSHGCSQSKTDCRPPTCRSCLQGLDYLDFVIGCEIANWCSTLDLTNGVFGVFLMSHLILASASKFTLVWTIVRALIFVWQVWFLCVLEIQRWLGVYLGLICPMLKIRHCAPYFTAKISRYSLIHTVTARCQASPQNAGLCPPILLVCWSTKIRGTSVPPFLLRPFLLP